MNKNKLSIQQYIKQPEVLRRIEELIGSRKGEFITSLSTIAQKSDLLAKCEPKSLMLAAITATAMGFSINQNLGFVYLIPFKKRDGAIEAQLQFGYKAYIQLAQRSGQFKTINSSDVKEGEIKTIDRLTGHIVFDWLQQDRDKKKTIGYVSYFELMNGFHKSLYMTIEELKTHGLKYSQTFKKGYGLWEDEFSAMSRKTVIKLLLSRFAPLSTDMQTAVLADQAVIHNDQYEYVDNKPVDANDVASEKEKERIDTFILRAGSIEELQKVKDVIQGDLDLQDKYEIRTKELLARTKYEK